MPVPYFPQAAQLTAARKGHRLIVSCCINQLHGGNNQTAIKGTQGIDATFGAPTLRLALLVFHRTI